MKMANLTKEDIRSVIETIKELYRRSVDEILFKFCNSTLGFHRADYVLL